MTSFIAAQAIEKAAEQPRAGDDLFIAAQAIEKTSGQWR